MNNIPLLSIIIPCFNAFSLMQKGLESLSEQKNDIEVIVVDDCSTDDSYEKLLDYSKRAAFKLQVYKNEKNSGPGISRNTGLEKASGKYVTFLDADDFLSNDFLSSVASDLESNVDCVLFDFNIVTEESTSICPIFYRDMFREGNISTEDTLVYVRGGTSGKIYRRSLLIENDVRFLDMKRYEDIPFTKCAVSYCSNIVYIKKAMYNYVQHENSLMHDRSLTDSRNPQKAFAYMSEKLKDRFPEQLEAIFLMDYMYAVGLTNAEKMKRRELMQSIKEMSRMYPACFKNRYLSNYPVHVKVTLSMIRLKSYLGLKFLVRAMYLLSKNA